MRINPVEIKHFELLQAVGFPNDALEEETIYDQLIAERAMCPWLASALFMLTLAAQHRNRALLAYLQADHGAEAQAARARVMATPKFPPPDGDVTLGGAIAHAQVQITSRAKTVGDAHARRRLVVKLYHWRKL